MIAINDLRKFDFEEVPIDPFWNTSLEKEMRIHRIHAYPAKFPYFITTKALEFGDKQSIQIERIADIFCGCGTTAFEAKRNNIHFWGCDINPVATLIAKVKSRKYKRQFLKKYFDAILFEYIHSQREDLFEQANDRLKYWYRSDQYNDLAYLRRAIFQQVPKRSAYLGFFLCAFSNVLKPTSLWLTKSIKPQIDPNKAPANVINAFYDQYRFMLSANDEIHSNGDSQTDIITGNFLDEHIVPPLVDMIITSPPYVTSYEYADLHQLSTLWLDIAEDYRELRQGSIGSLYHVYNFKREWKRLNDTGNRIVSLLLDQDRSKAYSVAKYFLDMQKVASKSYTMLNEAGLAVFVIGNTEYKGVRIDNAKHFAEALMGSGFQELLATKRKISNKILTPYRDELGKFSSDMHGRNVYSEEFILIGRK